VNLNGTAQFVFMTCLKYSHCPVLWKILS